MAGTITPNLTDISLCEADDWDGGVGALDAESMVQGAGCLTITYTGAGLRAVTMKTISSSVLTNKNIYGWLTFARLAMLETGANGGLRFRVEDSTKFAEWYVGGSDTSPTSGWYPYTCNCGVHPDRHGTAPETDDANEPDYGAITKVGWRVNLAIKGIVKWDAFRFGTGLSVKGGTSGDPATFTDIYNADNNSSYKYGVLVRTDSIFYLQGQLNIGSTTAGEATYFKDTSKVVVFPDRKVGIFYEIKVQGNSTGDTKIFLGAKSGVRGISGCVIRSAGAPKFKFTATDTYITELGLYGCIFFDADTISLPVSSATREVLDCTFELCAEVLASTCLMKYCNFVSADDRGVRIVTGFNITNSNFISCVHGVNIPAIGSYTFVSLVFSGNTYDIENSSTGQVTITPSGTSNPTTYHNTGAGATTTIEQIALTLTLTGLKTNSEVRIYQAGTTTEKGGTENSGTTYAYAYNYPPGFNVDIIVHHLGWIYFRLDNYVLGAADASLPVSQQLDRVYVNP